MQFWYLLERIVVKSRKSMKQSHQSLCCSRTENIHKWMAEEAVQSGYSLFSILTIPALINNILFENRKRKVFKILQTDRSSLIRVYPVCYLDKHFVNSSPDNQHFIWEQNRKVFELLQTVQTQIRLLLKKQSDQDLPCLRFCKFQIMNILFENRKRSVQNFTNSPGQGNPCLLFWQAYCEFQPDKEHLFETC